MSVREPIRVERSGPVAVVCVVRPEKRNALSANVRAGIADALAQLETDDTARVLVFTGEGDRAFIAGADLDEFAARTPEEQRVAMTEPTVFSRIAALPKPTIAMINGLALGGGCELALACDLRIAARSARLGQPEINLGLIPGGGGTQRLPRLVGEGAALWMILSGEMLTAEEALRIGLVDVVVPDEELRARTMKLAETLASKSPLALRNAKAAVRAAAERPLPAGLEEERELFLACFSSDEARRAIGAFLARRSSPGRDG